MAKEIALEEKASLMMELREEKARLKFELDKANQKEKAIQTELLEILDSKDIKSFRHKKFGLFTATERLWGKIEDFDKALKFFEEQGLDKEIFQLKPQSGRLNQFIRESLEKNEILPEGLGFAITKYISVRK